MSQWNDRIRNHQVWQQLNALGPVIDDAVKHENADAQVIDGLERIRAVLSLVGKRLATADPFTTHPTPLDGLAASMQNAFTEIQAFIADGSAGHITNANAHADTALTHLSQVSIPAAPEELAGLATAAIAYRASLEEQIQQARAATASLRAESDGLRTKLSELSTELTAERQRLSQLATEHQAQFSTSQEARAKEFSENQAARQERFATAIADYTQRLTDQNAEFTREREAAVADYEAEVAKLKTSYAEAAQKILDEMDEQRHQVEKLVGVIGNLGVTSGYLRVANQARVTMWVWQGITVVALGGVILVAYKAFIPVVQGNFTWEGLVGRVFLSLTVGVLAAYAANQADKFLEIERRNRKLALELEAIGPYLAPLPQEQQDKFRLDIGERSFGRDDYGIGKGPGKSPATVVDVLVKSKDFRDFITELVKAARQG